MKQGFKKRLETLETQKRYNQSRVSPSNIPAAERLIRLVMPDGYELGKVRTHPLPQFNPDEPIVIQVLKMVMPDNSSTQIRE